MRCVVNVATGNHFVKGQRRLTEWLAAHGENYLIWNDRSGLPKGSPTPEAVPSAFKAFALKEAADLHGAKTLLWADASILPIKPLDELWERIERDGFWIGAAGWNNYQWTANLAYIDLFADTFLWEEMNALECARIVNRTIPHVTTMAFGLSVEHPIGREILREFYRLAAETRAFCGPHRNTNCPNYPVPNERRAAPCGGPDVMGHRHCQPAMSVIAWRLGCSLTSSPEILAYKGSENETTVLCADGGYR